MSETPTQEIDEYFIDESKYDIDQFQLDVVELKLEWNNTEAIKLDKPQVYFFDESCKMVDCITEKNRMNKNETCFYFSMSNNPIQDITENSQSTPSPDTQLRQNNIDTFYFDLKNINNELPKKRLRKYKNLFIPLEYDIQDQLKEIEERDISCILFVLNLKVENAEKIRDDEGRGFVHLTSLCHLGRTLNKSERGENDIDMTKEESMQFLRSSHDTNKSHLMYIDKKCDLEDCGEAWNRVSQLVYKKELKLVQEMVQEESFTHIYDFIRKTDISCETFSNGIPVNSKVKDEYQYLFEDETKRKYEKKETQIDVENLIDKIKENLSSTSQSQSTDNLPIENLNNLVFVPILLYKDVLQKRWKVKTENIIPFERTHSTCITESATTLASIVKKLLKEKVGLKNVFESYVEMYSNMFIKPGQSILLDHQRLKNNKLDLLFKYRTYGRNYRIENTFLCFKQDGTIVDYVTTENENITTRDKDTANSIVLLDDETIQTIPEYTFLSVKESINVFRINLKNIPDEYHKIMCLMTLPEQNTSILNISSSVCEMYLARDSKEEKFQKFAEMQGYEEVPHNYQYWFIMERIKGKNGRWIINMIDQEIDIPNIHTKELQKSKISKLEKDHDDSVYCSKLMNEIRDYYIPLKTDKVIDGLSKQDKVIRLEGNIKFSYYLNRKQDTIATLSTIGDIEGVIQEDIHWKAYYFDNYGLISRQKIISFNNLRKRDFSPFKAVMNDIREGDHMIVIIVSPLMSKNVRDMKFFETVVISDEFGNKYEFKLTKNKEPLEEYRQSSIAFMQFTRCENEEIFEGKYIGETFTEGKTTLSQILSNLKNNLKGFKPLMKNRFLELDKTKEKSFEIGNRSDVIVLGISMRNCDIQLFSFVTYFYDKFGIMIKKSTENQLENDEVKYFKCVKDENLFVVGENDKSQLSFITNNYKHNIKDICIGLHPKDQIEDIEKHATDTVVVNIYEYYMKSETFRLVSQKEIFVGLLSLEYERLVYAFGFDDTKEKYKVIDCVKEEIQDTNDYRSKYVKRNRTITLKLIEAQDLLPMDKNGYSDPYFKFYFQGKKYKTNIVKKTLNPVFDPTKSTFTLTIQDSFTKQGEIKIEGYDYDFGSRNEFMGEVIITKDQIMKGTRWFNLTDAKKRIKKKTVSGMLKIELDIK